MNNVQIFKDKQFGNLRTLIIDSKPYFVAKDVTKALGYKNSSKAINDHCKGVTKRYILTNGGKQKTNCIPEGDIYRLVSQSKLPSAQKFESWVFDEVLPTIRKTGGYVTEGQEQHFIDVYFPTLSEETKVLMVKDLQKSVKELKPKAEYYDELVDKNLLTNLRDTAKELKIKQTEFINFLLDQEYVYRDQRGNLKPYAKYTPNMFQLKEFVASNGFVGTQMLVTPEGRNYFRKECIISELKKIKGVI